MSGARVAEATEEDIEAVAAFFWEGWHQAGPGAPGWAGASEEVMADLTRRETLSARLGDPGERMFLAWDGDRVVALAATRAIDAEVVELAGIVVLQYLVGQGIGTPLLAAAIRSAQDAGFRRMLVRTEAENTRAARFYRSRGFADQRTVSEIVEGEELELLELVLDLAR